MTHAQPTNEEQKGQMLAFEILLVKLLSQQFQSQPEPLQAAEQFFAPMIAYMTLQSQNSHGRDPEQNALHALLTTQRVLEAVRKQLR